MGTRGGVQKIQKFCGCHQWKLPSHKSTVYQVRIITDGGGWKETMNESGRAKVRLNMGRCISLCWSRTRATRYRIQGRANSMFRKVKILPIENSIFFSLMQFNSRSHTTCNFYFIDHPCIRLLQTPIFTVINLVKTHLVA